ncbi:MAG: alkaline phosphatase family protein, partial [Proteobacteria bacterium]|nr:alkaline phosphatase family protein [Pseudomonadota bacterium]
VAAAGRKQLRIAETEKYAHVTFFFNGGEERVFDGEERILVPSPKVATYDLKPEMAAFELTGRLVEAIEGGTFDLIVVNFANADMVGHTGDLDAAILAVQTVDTCLGRIEDAVGAAGGVLIITSDHGNAERMRDAETGQAHTAHTTGEVPLLVVHAPGAIRLSDGRLADVAPSVLHFLGLPQPEEMTGRCLIEANAGSRAHG